MNPHRNPRRIGVVATALVMVGGACGGSDEGVAASPVTTTTAAASTAAVSQPTSTAGATTSAVPAVSTTLSDAVETTTTAAPTDVPLGMTAEELCEVMPTVEIGEVMNSEREPITFASPSESITTCALLIGNLVNLAVDLMNGDGAAGFDEEVEAVSRMFAADTFEIEGVGDRAVGFESTGTQIMVLAGPWSLRIAGGSADEFSQEQAEAVGSLIADALR